LKVACSSNNHTYIITHKPTFHARLIGGEIKTCFLETILFSLFARIILAQLKNTYRYTIVQLLILTFVLVPIFYNRKD